MHIPLLDLKAHHAPIQDEILAAITRVVQSQAFILGEEVVTLEEQIASYCQTKFGIGVSSGTDALLLALMAVGIGSNREEVITSPYSFFATAEVIVRIGAKPVFVDIDPISYAMDPAKIERVITPKTKAIIPVHLYGQCADMKPILDIAQRHNLAVIEDAAQALGAAYPDGRRSGNMGTVGCFSFFPSKNLGAMGDAGMVVTNDAALADRLRTLRVHGAEHKYYHRLLGGNFRLDAMQAAILNVKLKYLDDWTRQRADNASQYESLFNTSGLLETKQVQLPTAVYAHAGIDNHHIYNQFVIRAQQRDQLRTHLREHGVASEIYYPVPLHLQECFGNLGYHEGDFPETERAAHETLALPIYPELNDEQQAYIVGIIRSFYTNS
ncbi:MAG TPA: DegT/DnrJ/EryC1/StrS family aminotransferase [Nitrospirales bacterium]|jgi:dTDP-4-amino-4,6-dideoxygalactose transaminase|nr:DegT/DnrJ/EryC1/StrS family aminotransferase [Nitrospirales bacterium]HIB53794.1 DegT/DnrJ/EryC1/StrS family aminotransferase [Nitrospirales bacterium]HIC04560.1 DegT/DnrJ/EryC1/StrS family aminotransferase [Nitrospirales bacterium]HIN33163.1 DegT/DnrJ/EryC1/StrS family aminotransferase [Nitrospirales bacterium]HIO21062.1 DegT/DnrJ/EryC1/StrS family aminotransferase [Nitrospirales bacterium]